MKLKTIAEIATIAAVIFAALEYIKVEPNALDEIPKEFRANAEKDVIVADITIEKEDYPEEKNSVYLSYKAAISMSGQTSRNLAIDKVVDLALADGDLKLAISAAKEMTGTTSKSLTLTKIVDKSLVMEDSAGFAVVAAELIPGSTSKNMALQKIVDYYSAKKKGNPGENPVQELSSLEIFKKIFAFADSTAYMDLSESEAKVFTENWLKNRTYDEFLEFKEVFMFADSNAYMGLNSEESKDFSLNWIDNYSMEEFSVFKDAFKFAESSAGMSLSEEKATLFALSKVKEFREENAANN